MERLVFKGVTLEEIILRAKDGDEEAIQFILDKYRPLILKLAGKYTIPSYDFEDVVQYGYLTLIKAIKMYKVGSNSFNGYAIRAIRNNIMDLFKRHIRIYSEVPNNEVLNICVDNSLSIEDNIIAGEEIKRLYKGLDELSKEDRKIINEHYFEGKTMKSIADENKIKYRKLIKEKNRIIKKLKKLT
ncbi:sigma-70 family RNA polymerase sigma factor [Clostridium sp. DL1XJH146]